MDFFSRPLTIRTDLLRNVRLRHRGWSGRSYVVVFPTKYCPVACGHCYFASTMPVKGDVSGGRLGDTDFTRLRDFVADADTDLLQITGGGEPLLELDFVLGMIREYRARRMLLNTAGLFATTPQKAADVIHAIYGAYRANPVCGSFIFRLSVDAFHLRTVKKEKLLNVVRLFREHFAEFSANGFILKLHTMVGDTSVEELLEPLADDIRCLGPTEVQFKDGSIVAIGHAPLMRSNSRPDLADVETTDVAVQVFDEVRDPVPGLYMDDDLNLGLCFLVHESGDVELWNTSPADNLKNIRTSDFAQVRHSVLSDVLQVAALERTASYVESLAAEVDPLSVRRAKAIGSATLLNRRIFSDARLSLYVSVRIIQDYLAEGRLTRAELEGLGEDALALIASPRETLQELYRSSGYDVVEQMLDRAGTNAHDLAALYGQLVLRHFDIPPAVMIERLTKDHRLGDDVKREFLGRVTEEARQPIRVGR